MKTRTPRFTKLSFWELPLSMVPHCLSIFGVVFSPLGWCWLLFLFRSFDRIALIFFEVTKDMLVWRGVGVLAVGRFSFSCTATHWHPDTQTPLTHTPHTATRTPALTHAPTHAHPHTHTHTDTHPIVLCA